MNRTRTCIGCRTQAPKMQLMRIVRTPSGHIAFDVSGRASGRGAYVCSKACFVAACQKGRMAAALKCKVDASACQLIEAELEQVGQVPTDGYKEC